MGILSNAQCGTCAELILSHPIGRDGRYFCPVFEEQKRAAAPPVLPPKQEHDQEQDEDGDHAHNASHEIEGRCDCGWPLNTHKRSGGRLICDPPDDPYDEDGKET